MQPYHKIDAREDQDGLVSAPVGVSQPGSKHGRQVAGALKQVHLRGCKSWPAPHDSCQVNYHIC